MSQPIVGQQYTFKLGLDNRASAGHFKAAPTIGTSDFRVSINGGVLTTLTNVPTATPSGSAIVAVTLTASEMWAPDPVVFGTSSASEWNDVIVPIYTMTDCFYLMKLASILGVDMSSLGTVGARSPINAFRAIRNRITSSGQVMAVYAEDDTTAVWTATLTTNASADPIVESNPA